MHRLAMVSGVLLAALTGDLAAARDVSSGMASGRRHATPPSVNPKAKATAPSPQPIPYPNQGGTARSTGGGHRGGR